MHIGSSCPIFPYTSIHFFLTLSDLAQLVKALKKLTLENLLAFHRKERVFADKGIAECEVSQNTSETSFSERKRKYLSIFLFLKLTEILVFL